MLIFRVTDERKPLPGDQYEQFKRFGDARRNLALQLRRIRKTIKRSNEEHAVTVDRPIETMRARTIDKYGQYDYCPQRLTVYKNGSLYTVLTIEPVINLS